MNPIVAADKWIYSQLAGDAVVTGLVGTRIYGHTIRITPVVYPLVYFTMPGPAPNKLTVNAVRIWSELLYAIRFVGKVESFAALEAGAAAIERLFDRTTGSNASGEIIASVYESPFQMIEHGEDGTEIRHLGGLFRLQVQ